MFVRKNKNRSGSVSVQIVFKINGKTKVIETVGISKNLNEIDRLSKKAKVMIHEISGQASLLPLSNAEIAIKNFVENLTNAQVCVIGPELVFGKIFDAIGFGEIKDKLFRHLVITCLVYPGSKLKTVDYLQRYKNIQISVDKIYRFLDKLKNKYKEKAEQIAFNYTKKTLGGKISVVFYDMTTLYFEAEDEDDLRKIGFNKDGKFKNPQIMIGLLVGQKGYPIGYDIFQGNTFEGHTLIPILKKFQEKFNLEKPIVIADAALLNKDNLEELENKNYQYIIGGRIKNESEAIKKKILQLSLSDKESSIINKVNENAVIRLIVSYSSKRAKKDLHNRQRGLKRLETSLKSGKLTKKHINNRGYNKYLKLKGKIKIEIDYGKFRKDGKWDGLKGYITNSNLSPDEVIKNYTNLWQIEKAFRISKTDLRIRPIYHRLKSRIEAHICIAFTAYTIYKELERLLYKHKAPFSVKRAGELTHTMYELIYTLPETLKEKKQILKMSKEQQVLFKIIQSEKI